jgi:hypothetical protein
MRTHRHGGPWSAAVFLFAGIAGGACAQSAPTDLAGQGSGYQEVTLDDGSRSSFSRCEEQMEEGGYCLSLRYVSYLDDGGESVLSAVRAQDNLDAINEVFDQCRIQFQVDHFTVVRPDSVDLNFNTETSEELFKIRSKFKDEDSLLVVNTGDWSGSLGEGSANAWTMMPGTAPYGAILEESVANYPNIIAHELGHYLGLDHVDDSTQLMNPVIHSYSTELSEEECDIARDAIRIHWRAMTR